MKTKYSLLIVPCLFLLSFTLNKTALNDSERKYAIDYLKKTKDAAVSSTKKLSTAQLNFKPEPTAWSVADCMEHIAIAENLLFGMVTGALQEKADPSRRSEVKITDEQLIKMITDRTNKVKTKEPFEPKNSFGSFEGSLKEFTKKRDERISYLKKTEDDLRNRYVNMPFGTIDAYQVILFIAAHSERHTTQIQEIMAHADFPKK